MKNTRLKNLILSVFLATSVNLISPETSFSLEQKSNHSINLNLPVFSSAFSPDEKLIAFSSENMIKIIDIATGENIKTLTDNSEIIFDITFSPDNNYLASTNNKNEVTLWSVKEWKKIKSFTAHTDVVSKVVFNYDNSLIATAGDDDIVKVWDVATMKELYTFNCW